MTIKNNKLNTSTSTLTNTEIKFEEKKTLKCKNQETNSYATRGYVLKIRYDILCSTTNSCYIGWKFVGFMEDHEFIFFTFVLRNNFV